MTQDEIILMANKAGIVNPQMVINTLEAFAKLVAERALAQPEQEPVAWGVFEGNLHDMFFSQEEAQEMADLKGSHAEVRPFYTAPPQPEQKPMHPQIQKMYQDYFDKCFRESSALDAAVQAEREACAKVCDEYGDEYGEFIADVIRSRGNT
jgi:hypothetical protein